MAVNKFKRTAWYWRLPLWTASALVLLPLFFLVRSWLSVDTDLWIHLWQTQLVDLILNTLVLVFGVGFGVSLLGVSLAWLTAVCDFPGRKIFDWALILPLAVPAYVLAFVALGVFDFGGVAQTLLRSLGISNYVDIRGPSSVVILMTLVLYPYVYLLARSAFLAQGTELLEIARTLGVKPIPAFFRVVIPAARPAVIAGVSLALMETLADFGAVSVFGFDTFTTAIYKSWYSLFSLETAAQLASLLMLFVILTLVAERRFRPPEAEQGRAGRIQARVNLKPLTAWLVTGFCSLVLFLSVLLPLIQLTVWAINNFGYALDTGFNSLVLRTFVLGLMAALVILILALPCALSARRIKSGMLQEMPGLGYAIPGSVLAVGVMYSLAAADSGWVAVGQLLGWDLKPLFLGSLVGMLFAYVVRFFLPGYGAIASSVRRIRHSYIESGALMGAPSTRIFFGVSLPLIMPGLLTGALIVFVDVIKEMPASLLLRPFGWDTLAIKIYELTSEGEWQRAGLPALVLVLVSLVPVFLLIRQSRLTGALR